MSFHVRSVSGATVVEVGGSLVVANRKELKDKVLAELEGGAARFVVDFGRTDYIDSSGLGVLVGLSKRIREAGGTLRLARLSEDLQTLFELTKLDTLFEIRSDLDEALAV